MFYKTRQFIFQIIDFKEKLVSQAIFVFGEDL